MNREDPCLSKSLRWETYTPSGPFAEEGQWLFIGRWPVATVYWHVMCPEDHDLPYIAQDHLPRGKITFKEVRFKTFEEAQARCEARVKRWLADASEFTP